MNAPTRQTYFDEQQRFPPWIIAIPLVTVVLFGLLVAGLALGGVPAAAVLVGLVVIVVLLPLAVVHFAIRLATTVDTEGLHLRIRPTGWSLLPRRLTRKDVPLAEIRRWGVGTFDSLAEREFWGWHLWGLAVGPRGYLYVMRPSGPFNGRGVRIELANGDTVFVGSRDPSELARALERARSNGRS